MNRSVDQLSRFRTPGVHIDYVAEDKRAEFKTGIPVFVGFGKLTALALRYCKEPWCRITSWQQFEQSVEMVPLEKHGESFLRYAVRGFFENGGECCVVLPIAETDTTVEALGEPFLDSGKMPGGESSRKPGIMEDIEDIDLVCIPDLMMEGIGDSSESVIKVQKQVLEHCRKMGDRFAILDVFPVNDKADIDKVIGDRHTISGSEGAIYFPWVYVQPLTMSMKAINQSESYKLHKPIDFLSIRANGEKPCLVPPCGHVAGIYARTDAKIGVFKAPANEIVEGVLDIGVYLNQIEQGKLNDAGINCFRSSLSRGIRVWGARTLSVYEHDQYVTTRRLFSTLVRWIEKNMSDLVFETNEPSLWRRIKHRLEGYCYELFQKGALKGQSPQEAYYVKCDGELNGIEFREMGKVISEVGLASMAPSEFILVRITQSASGTSAAALSLN
jgi:uncharacterized protein